MEISRKFLLIGFCMVFMSCSQDRGEQAKNEKSTNDSNNQSYYKNAEFGWKIPVPNNWQISDQDQIKTRQSKSKKESEESLEQEIDISEAKNLLGFERDKFNVFLAVAEPFKEEFDGQFEEQISANRHFSIQHYLRNAFKAEASEVEMEEIGGLTFRKYSIQLFSPDGNLILKQIVYGRLINGYHFGVRMDYNNEELGREMLEAWRSSEFKPSQE